MTLPPDTGVEKAQTIYSSKKQTIRQKPGEGAGDYGHRTQALLKRLLRAHNSDVRMLEDAKVYLKEKGERENLEKYLIGLEGYLQHQIRSTSPKDLRTAIERAIDMERGMSARRKEVKIQESPTEIIIIQRAPVCSMQYAK